MRTRDDMLLRVDRGPRRTQKRVAAESRCAPTPTPESETDSVRRVAAMADIEFRVVSDRREGLLLELGQLVIASGFVLLRQRMTSTGEGVVLVMVVRGPEQNLLGLEDRLGSHHLVRTFEASVRDGTQPAESAPVHAPPPRASAERAADAPAVAPQAIDPQRMEGFLSALAMDYPNVFGRVLAFEHDLPDSHRESAARYAGTRLGAWIYKRDYALGARLGLADSLKHIVLPATKALLHAELAGDVLRVRNSPLCNPRLHRGPSCHFLRGCFEGLLNEPGHLGRPRVTETQCRTMGAEVCTFAFSA